MSEETEQQQAPNSAAERGPVDGYPADEALYDAEHRDWVLQTFVGICNLSGMEIPVTLNLGGSYVAGHIVAPQAYLDGLIDDLRVATFQGRPSESASKAKEILEQTIKRMKVSFDAELIKGPEAWSDPVSFRPRYIHLRGATFFVPNDMGHTLRGRPRKIWWRGKIESVNGFYFGVPFAD